MLHKDLSTRNKVRNETSCEKESWTNNFEGIKELYNVRQITKLYVATEITISLFQQVCISFN